MVYHNIYKSFLHSSALVVNMQFPINISKIHYKIMYMVYVLLCCGHTSYSGVPLRAHTNCLLTTLSRFWYMNVLHGAEHWSTPPFTGLFPPRPRPPPPPPPPPPPRPPPQKLLRLISKPFELNLRYLAQRIYGSGEIYWMTFPWPWPKVTAVASINKKFACLCD